MNELTTKEKFKAIDKLSAATIGLNMNDKWYVTQGVEIDEGVKKVIDYGMGDTLEEAISDHWEILTNAPLIRIIQGGRRVRWNGFMWDDVTP